MTADQNQPSSLAGPSSAEILRLRQQLAAREEAIRQLTRRIQELPDSGSHDAGDPDPDVLADTLASSRVLESELHNLRRVVADQQAEIAALRHQLGVFDRLGISSAVGGAQKARRLLRRASGRR
jgi:hypothetical protein